jgi:hypothetical protein
MVLLVFGPGYVLGTSHYWDMPVLDHRSYVMGYRYFLHEPWHWPIFEARMLNVPYRQSIAFSDSMPLWALVHKAVATAVPPWRDYSARAFLGLWYGLACMLQTAFGVANLRALGHRSWGATIVTAVCFVAIPAWAWRFLHASLYAHFLLLSALCFYLNTPPGAPAPLRLRIAQIVQLGVAALINPYHTVMSLAVFGASLVRSRAWRPAAAWFAGGCAVVLGALALAGYFAAEAGGARSGFGAASSNLLGPFLPRRSGWLGEGAWIDPTGLQYDGMCYLGMGLLVLGVLQIPRAREAMTAIRRHAALAVVAAGAGILALSNHVYLGSHRVLVYPIPHILHWIPDQFRGPGRFSWLPMYVVVIFLLSRGFARFATGWRRLVLPALAVVQLVDVAPYWRAWREVTTAPAPVLDASWRPLIAGSDQVAVFPPHGCNSDPSWEPATRIQYLVSEQAVPINGVYSARSIRDCAADIAALLAFRAQPGTLYVFVAPMTGFARRLAATGMPCAEFSFGEVCQSDRALIDATHWTPTPPVAPLAYGDKLDVADPAAAYLELGWPPAQAGSRSIDGPARLVLRPTGTPPPNPVLRIDAFAVLCGGHVAQDVDVVIGGSPVGTLHLDAGSSEGGPAFALPIAEPGVLARPFVEIELRLRDARAPHPLRCTGTRLPFGVHVRQVWIESATVRPSPATP